jgi:rhodanese-related sulfurtransferase
MKKTIFYSSFGILMLACAANENKTGEETDHNPSTNTEVVEKVSTDQTNEGPVAKNVSADEFHTMISATPGQLIDVRTPGEYSGGTIDGAVNIDYYSDDFKAQIAELDKNQPVYVFCRSGGRSSQAMQIFKEEGFTEIYNLIGGYSGWNY